MYSEGITVGEIRTEIQLMFNLDDAIVDRIKFSYKTKIGNKGNSRVVSLSNGDDKFKERRIITDDDPAIAG